MNKFNSINSFNDIRKLKKIIKTSLIGFSGLFLLGLISYFILDEPLPEGESGKEAEQIADKMLNALNKDAWDSTEYIAWTFPGNHEYQWFKSKDSVIVKWDDFTVHLNTQTAKGIVKSEEALEQKDSLEIIDKAYRFFINDSFWLIAPFKVRDPGTSRKMVKHNGKDALLVTYSSGGVTPGDSYLWILDDDYRPKAWKLWVEIIPIGGIEFSWEAWENANGALISTVHKGPLQIDIQNLSAK